MKDLKVYSGNQCLTTSAMETMTDEKDIVSQAYIILYYEEPITNSFDQIHFKVVDVLKANYNVNRVDVVKLAKNDIQVKIILNSGESVQIGI